jgi:hypothetical protein
LSQIANHHLAHHASKEIQPSDHPNKLNHKTLDLQGMEIVTNEDHPSNLTTPAR